MDINGEKVTKSEFLQIYLKNNNDPKYDKSSLDDYLELMIYFFYYDFLHFLLFSLFCLFLPFCAFSSFSVIFLVY